MSGQPHEVPPPFSGGHRAGEEVTTKMTETYEKPQVLMVGDFRKDTAFTSKGYWTDVLGWWF